MTSVERPLMLLMNSEGLPCRVCGEILPFMTRTNGEERGVTGAHTVAAERRHIPIVVDDPWYAPSQCTLEPLADHPEVRVWWNISLFYRVQRDADEALIEAWERQGLT